ncbi:hypothetical protein GCM10009616_31300 [Microlunatus lacustris]
MKALARWSVALLAGVSLSLGLLAPVARATSPLAAPAAQPSRGMSVPDVAPGEALQAAVRQQVGLVPSPVERAAQRALNPDDYECATTDLDRYIDGLLAGLSGDELDFLFSSGVLDFPAVEALYLGTQGDPDFALGGKGKKLEQTFRDLQRFWDVRSDDIQLLAMYGEMLTDADRVARLLVAVYGFSAAEAAEYAEYVSSVVRDVPAFQDGAFPLFTLNAFAFTGEGDPDPMVAEIPDKIIMGDGLLRYFAKVGLSDVGPRVVLAHEFGHHIQFELNLFDSPLTGAEATRRTELMADAFATYYAVHARGLSLNAKRVTAALQSFYDVGDCYFDDPGHHGTPQQRARSAAWAASLASNARPQGKIMSAATFAALFDEKLPELVAPDARR